MITIDGQTYRAEIRASDAPPPRPDQEVPAGSSGGPGMDESSYGHDHKVIAGRVVETHDPGPAVPPQAGLVPGGAERIVAGGGAAMPYLPGGAPAYPIADPSRPQGETHDGLPADPSGSGAPLRQPFTVRDPGSGETYANPNAPTLNEDLPLQPGEEEAARALLSEARALYGEVRVLYFVRYPTDRRVALKFEEGLNPGEVRGLQRAY